MKPPRWSDVETEALEDIAINHPPDLLVQRFNAWAIGNGFSNRSHQALLTRLSRCGINIRAAGDWVSSGYICRVLGVGPDTPHRWTDRGWVEAHRDGRGRRYFRRLDLRRMARQRPASLGGISADRLFLLLEDRSLADRIAIAHTRRGMEPRAVLAIETGWRYPSVRAAASRMYVARQAIQHAIRTGGTAAGYHWRHA